LTLWQNSDKGRNLLIITYAYFSLFSVGAFTIQS